jgi:WD40 repeat protein
MLDDGDVSEAARLLDGCPEEFRQPWAWKHIGLRRDLSLVTLREHPGEVWGCVYSPDGRYFATASAATVTLWDAKTKKRLRVLSGKERFMPVTFGADSKRLAAGSDDGTAWVWEVETCSKPLVLRGHDLIVQGLAFSPDGRRIVTGSWDGSVCVWDANSGARLKTLEVSKLNDSKNPVLALEFSRDGNALIAGSGRGDLRVWNSGTGEVIARTDLNGASIHELAITSAGDLMALACGDGRIRIFDTGDWTLVSALDTSIPDIRSVAFSPDGGLVAAAGGNVLPEL